MVKTIHVAEIWKKVSTYYAKKRVLSSTPFFAGGITAGLTLYRKMVEAGLTHPA
jgi:hypothetical protein